MVTFPEFVFGAMFGLCWFFFGIAWRMRSEGPRIEAEVARRLAAERAASRKRVDDKFALSVALALRGMKRRFSDEPIPGSDDLAELDETPEPEPCRFCYAPATETGD